MTEVTFNSFFNSLDKLERATLYVEALGSRRYKKYCSSWVFIRFAIPTSLAVFEQLDFPTVPIPAISTTCIYTL